MSSSTYDGNGLRTSATTTPSGGSASTQHFAWDAATAVPELLQDSTNAYIYGPFGVPYEQVNLSTGTIQYLVADALDSVRGVVNSSGSLTATTSYDAWGNPETTGGLSTYTPFGFTGGYTDPTGLVYLLNRYYDPKTGSFVNEDPDLRTTGMAYAYANDDPVNAEDPLGLLACSGGGGKSSCVKQIPTIKVSVKITAKGNPRIQLASSSNEPYSVSAKVSVTYTSDKGLETETSTVFHYTSIKAAESISGDGELIVPGGSGRVYVSPTQYASAAEAQEALALPETPDGYYQIPLSRVPGLGKFTEVNPDFGFGGGGLEATTPDDIDVGGIPFIPFG